MSQAEAEAELTDNPHDKHPFRRKQQKAIGKEEDKNEKGK